MSDLFKPNDTPQYPVKPSKTLIILRLGNLCIVKFDYFKLGCTIDNPNRAACDENF